MVLISFQGRGRGCCDVTVTQCHLARRDVRLVCPVGVWREVIAVAQMARRGTCEGRYVWRLTTAKGDEKELLLAA